MLKNEILKKKGEIDIQQGEPEGTLNRLISRSLPAVTIKSFENGRNLQLRKLSKKYFKQMPQFIPISSFLRRSSKSSSFSKTHIPNS